MILERSVSVTPQAAVLKLPQPAPRLLPSLPFPNTSSENTDICVDLLPVP